MKSETNDGAVSASNSLRDKAFNVLAVVLCVFVLVAVNTTLLDANPISPCSGCWG